MGETSFIDKQISFPGDNAKEQAAMDKLRQEYPFNKDIFALHPDEFQVFKENMGELNRRLDEENQRVRALLKEVKRITGVKDGAHNQETVPKITLARGESASPQQKQENQAPICSYGKVQICQLYQGFTE